MRMSNRVEMCTGFHKLRTVATTRKVSIYRTKRQQFLLEEKEWQRQSQKARRKEMTS